VSKPRIKHDTKTMSLHNVAHRQDGVVRCVYPFSTAEAVDLNGERPRRTKKPPALRTPPSPSSGATSVAVTQPCRGVDRVEGVEIGEWVRCKASLGPIIWSGHGGQLEQIAEIYFFKKIQKYTSPKEIYKNICLPLPPKLCAADPVC
jgi:hypothetical protein